MIWICTLYISHSVIIRTVIKATSIHNVVIIQSVTIGNTVHFFRFLLLTDNWTVDTFPFVFLLFFFQWRPAFDVALTAPTTKRLCSEVIRSKPHTITITWHNLITCILRSTVSTYHLLIDTNLFHWSLELLNWYFLFQHGNDVVFACTGCWFVTVVWHSVYLAFFCC